MIDFLPAKSFFERCSQSRLSKCTKMELFNEMGEVEFSYSHHTWSKLLSSSAPRWFAATCRSDQCSGVRQNSGKRRPPSHAGGCASAAGKACKQNQRFAPIRGGQAHSGPVHAAYLSGPVPEILKMWPPRRMLKRGCTFARDRSARAMTDITCSP